MLEMWFQNCRGGGGENLGIATLIAYDLQAGAYVAQARNNMEFKQRWCRQIAELISPVLPTGGRLLEVGVGEATTLAGVLDLLNGQAGKAFGFDMSWSRIAVANDWLQEQSQVAELFVGDLMHMPLADNCIDVVYSAHSLEPNGGREKQAIAECLRVARHAVVLIEPLYELASHEAQARMRHHGYVRGLSEAAEALGAEVLDYRLLEYAGNPLNPSGVLLLRKQSLAKPAVSQGSVNSENSLLACPLTQAPLENHGDFFFAPEVGVAYPVLQNIPLLRPEHAIVASSLLRETRVAHAINQ